MSAILPFQNLRKTIGFSALLAFGLATFPASAGEKIKFSDPSGITLNSNSAPTLAPPNTPFGNSTGALHQVQEDLFGPLRNSINFDDPANSQTPPPMYRPPAPSLTKREKQLLDQRRNWAFTDLNDLYPDNSVDKQLSLEEQKAAGLETRQNSVVERFYDDKGKSSTALRRSQAAGQDFYGVRQSLTNNGLNFLAKAYSQNNGAVKTILAAAVMSGNTTPGSLSPSIENFSQQRADKLAEEKRMDDFRHLLDPNLAATTTQNWDPFKAAGVSTPTLAGSTTLANSTAEQMAQARRMLSGSTAPLDPTTMALHSAITDNPTAAALGLPNPTRKTTTVAPKTFQQLLDPFAANAPKPKF